MLDIHVKDQFYLLEYDVQGPIEQLQLHLELAQQIMLDPCDRTEMLRKIR